MVRIQERRELSSAIAAEAGVPHASPQAIIFSGGVPAWIASHWEITGEALEKALEGAK